MKNALKRSFLLSTLTTLLLGSIPVQASERALDAHEHGVSTLTIAQEGKVILFALESPGDDIVGFERAAENDDQKLAVKNALSLLKKPETIFKLPAEASCKASAQKAEFETEEEHAGFHVTWTMTCENPAKALSLALQFFDLFEHAVEVEVEAIGNAGQVAIEVDKGQTSVDISAAIGG